MVVGDFPVCGCVGPEFNFAWFSRERVTDGCTGDSFGWDDCYRVPVLRGAGFEVIESKSLDELSADLQRNREVDAVIVSEDIEPTEEQAADMVRRAALSPVILFRRSRRRIDESKFDKVYTYKTPPDVWLNETAVLIAKGYKLKAEAPRLPAEETEVQAKTLRQRVRAHEMRKK
jgi:hypothetical protein